MLDELRLLPRLGELGPVELIGSAATGLMVWRDIDVSVRVPAARQQAIGTVLGGLVAEPAVLSVDYRDETGSRSPSGRERDQRHYAVVRYQGPTGAPWKIDLSLWTAAGPDGEWHDIPGVRARLTTETRTAILWIKETLMAEGRYPGDVASVEIYDAVLNGGVRTPYDFASTTAMTRLPGHHG